MANPSPTYGGVNWPGADGLRVPVERGGFVGKATQTQPSLDTYGEIDLGAQSGTVVLTAQQAGASLITVNPSAAVTLVFPVCQPGMSQFIQNLSATYTVTCEISGNVTNTAVCAVSVMSTVVHTGTNGGMYLQASH